MKYPYITLEETKNNTFFYAEYPKDKEKGSFLEIIENEETIAIKVDRFTTIPFYYIVINNKLYGSTKFDSLVKSLPLHFEKELNIEAAIDFLITNTLLAEKTFIKGIKRISFGHELVFNKSTGNYTETSYWTLPSDIVINSEKYFLKNLEESFLNVIENEVSNHNTIGIHLSGGMDSRNILGALLKLNISFKTYTYGLNENIDMQIAKLISKKLSLESYFFEWEGLNSFKKNTDLHFYLTDGMQSLIHGHGIEIHKQEVKDVETILYGHFLDFFIQAHMYKSEFEDNNKDTDKLLYQLFNGGSCSIINADIMESKMFNKEYIGMYRNSIEKEIKKFNYMIPEKRYDAMYFIHHGLRRLMPQMQSGAQFLDFKLPALDKEYFSITWSIPGKIRKDRKLQEKLLNKLSPLMMEIPIVKDNSNISYMGNNINKKIFYKLKNRIKHSRFNYFINEYDYYGQGLQELGNKYLFEMIKKEVLLARLERFDFIKKSYIDNLFSENKFIVGLSSYSTFYTLSKFINKYLDK